MSEFDGSRLSGSVSIFLPLRSGSQRVKNKNTRPFLKDGTSLFQLKMRQLLALSHTVLEIVISTDDMEVMEQARPFQASEENVTLIKRPRSLCLSSTKVADLIAYVPSVTRGDHILWVHATAPFVNASDYLGALSNYQRDIENGPFDSLMSVSKIQQFIWDDRKKSIINCNRTVNPWPNTQDLDPLYEINHAYYMADRSIYEELGDRIGKRPSLMVMDSVKKMDIDWPEDFELAAIVARAMKESEIF
ncbi:MAG: acylneuraminate cytidylyltransferase family protein [Pseudomonadota bacterium]